MKGHERHYYVYLLASRSRQLYIGITGNILRRVLEHREHRPGTYTARYDIDRLVWFERYTTVQYAIARETELKDWRRERKVAVIEANNPTWEDSSAAWGSASVGVPKQTPSLRYGMTEKAFLSSNERC